MFHKCFLLNLFFIDFFLIFLNESYFFTFNWMLINLFFLYLFIYWYLTDNFVIISLKTLIYRFFILLDYHILFLLEARNLSLINMLFLLLNITYTSDNKQDFCQFTIFIKILKIIYPMPFLKVQLRKDHFFIQNLYNWLNEI